MSRHKPLADEVKVLAEFGGLFNAKRSKDFGHKGLTVARNIEITDTKHIVRRDGFSLLDGSAYTAVYGNQPQDQLYAVKAGDLVRIDPDGAEHVLTSGLTGDIFCWDEDAAGTVYFTSNKGSSGRIYDGQFQPLSLPMPEIQSAGVVDAGTWEYRPFNLGAGYGANDMQVVATYQMADGRESAPGESVTIPVTPEVRMIRLTIPTAGVATRIYATAPGGSTYYLVGVTTNAVTTLMVKNMNMTATGLAYEFPLSCMSFPRDANLLAFYNGVLYAPAYTPSTGLGVVYESLPLQPHMFNMAEDFISVNGQPLLILPFVDGLIIGTDQMIYHYAPQRRKISGSMANEVLTEVANYGVIPGVCGDVFDGDAYFWTRRGIAKAHLNDRGLFKYELLTKDALSVDPGVFNHAHLFHDRGYLKLVASTISGNAPFNAWKGR